LLRTCALQCLALYIGHNGRANLTRIAVKDAHDNCFASCTASVSRLRSEAFTAISVHVAEFATHESLIDFHTAALGSA
jgi:hypothetical protein